MRRKNNRFWKKGTAVIWGLAVFLGVGGIVLGFSLPAAAGQASPGMEKRGAELVVNQGLGMGLEGRDGEFYPMDLLVADRNTGFFVQIQPEVWQEVGGRPTLLVSDSNETWRFADSEYREEYGLLCFDTSEQMSWEAGQYDVRVNLSRDLTLERELVFNEMREIGILVVPITGYYSGELRQTGALGEVLWEYTEKVYPVGDDDLQWEIYDGRELTFDQKRYDLDTSLGRLRVWQQLKQLQDQEAADMVIGIVPGNMRQKPSAQETAITGFTFGENVSVISLEDTCPQVTIAHEIGHCLFLGDEYENGTFSVSMNMPPYGMKGKDRYRLSETVEGTSPYILGGTADEWQGSGTLVYGEQYPYDVLSREILFRDMTSFMGLSGYQEPEYWVTTQIWEALYLELCEKH